MVKKKRRKKGKRSLYPWDSEDSSEPEHKSSDEEIEEEDEDEVLKFDENYDEFACEEQDPDDEPVINEKS